MQLAVQSKLTFCRPNSRLDLIRLASRLGIWSLELEDDLALGEPELSAVRRQLEQAGLELFSLHVPCTCWPRTDRRFSDSQKRICRGMERAHQLRAKAVVLVPRTLGKVSVAEAQASYCEHSAYALSLAEPLGLGVSVNNSGLHAAAFGHPDFFAELLAVSSRKLRMTLDVANFPLAGHCPLAAIRLLEPALDVIHLKDWTIPQQQGTVTGISRSLAMRLRRQVMSSPLGDLARHAAGWLGVARHVPRVVCGTDGTWYQGEMIGDGIIDIPSCLERLQEIQFTGYLCIEYEGTGDLEQALRTGVTRVREMLTSIAATASPQPGDTPPHFAA